MTTVLAVIRLPDVSAYMAGIVTFGYIGYEIRRSAGNGVYRRLIAAFKFAWKFGRKGDGPFK